MIYIPSQELIDIFLKNGFKDVTAKMYPEHHTLSLNKGYDPRIMKRVLATGTKNYVQFDYTNIIPCYNGGCTSDDQRYELTEDELKSIITFFKLPYQTRAALRRSRTKIPELYKEYYYSKQNPGWHDKRYEKRLLSVFDSVILN